MRRTLTTLGLSALASAAVAETPVLTVYTYDSFVSDWGPGPQIEAAFEETCGCDLRLLAAGDGASLLSRLRLEGARTEADVVLGLDTSLIATARETGLLAPHGRDLPPLALPMSWEDDMFIPFDWGYFAFVYDSARLTEVPRSFEALAASDLSVVIQDPRSSTPGLGLLLWVQALKGDEAPAFWADLADNVVTVTKGWSEAYGLFLDGEADMVLSYTTSPAYHLIAEEDDAKAFATFDEGHYMQIEVAAMTASTEQPELAAAFLDFVLSPGFQDAIPTTNWMYPAAAATSVPEGFPAPLSPETSLLAPAEDVPALRDKGLEGWLSGLSG